MPAIARIGDEHDCPKHGKNKIVAGSAQTLDGMGIARMGDACACGGTIVEGSSIQELDSKPVAYVGCKTSCGGVITSGSATGEVAG